MTTREEKIEQQQAARREMASSVADGLLTGLDRRMQDKLHGKTVELLLASKEGFDSHAAEKYIAERISEWSELPGFAYLKSWLEVKALQDA